MPHKKRKTKCVKGVTLWRCPFCGEWKPLDAFYTATRKDGTTRPSSQCKTCVSQATRCRKNRNMVFDDCGTITAQMRAVASYLSSVEGATYAEIKKSYTTEYYPSSKGSTTWVHLMRLIGRGFVSIDDNANVYRLVKKLPQEVFPESVDLRKSREIKKCASCGKGSERTQFIPVRTEGGTVFQCSTCNSGFRRKREAQDAKKRKERYMKDSEYRMGCILSCLKREGPLSVKRIQHFLSLRLPPGYNKLSKSVVFNLLGRMEERQLIDHVRAATKFDNRLRSIYYIKGTKIPSSDEALIGKNSPATLPESSKVGSFLKDYLEHKTPKVPLSAVAHLVEKFSDLSDAEKMYQKHKARSQTQAAVRKGILVPSIKCEMCLRTPKESGGRKLHSHHPDYSKPYDVKWLCSKCHGMVHSIERKFRRLQMIEVFLKHAPDGAFADEICDFLKRAKAPSSKGDVQKLLRELSARREVFTRAPSPGFRKKATLFYHPQFAPPEAGSLDK